VPFGVQIGKRQVGDREGAAKDPCDENHDPEWTLIPGEQRASKAQTQYRDEENNPAAPVDGLDDFRDLQDDLRRNLVENPQDDARNHLKNEENGGDLAEQTDPARMPSLAGSPDNHVSTDAKDEREYHRAKNKPAGDRRPFVFDRPRDVTVQAGVLVSRWGHGFRRERAGVQIGQRPIRVAGRQVTIPSGGLPGRKPDQGRQKDEDGADPNHSSREFFHRLSPGTMVCFANHKSKPGFNSSSFGAINVIRKSPLLMWPYA